MDQFVSASKLKKTSLRKPIISWEIQLTILRDKKDSFYELPSSVLMTLSQKSNCEVLLGNHNTKYKKDLDEVVFYLISFYFNKWFYYKSA